MAYVQYIAALRRALLARGRRRKHGVQQLKRCKVPYHSDQRTVFNAFFMVQHAHLEPAGAHQLGQHLGHRFPHATCVQKVALELLGSVGCPLTERIHLRIARRHPADGVAIQQILNTTTSLNTGKKTGILRRGYVPNISSTFRATAAPKSVVSMTAIGELDQFVFMINML